MIGDAWQTAEEWLEEFDALDNQYKVAVAKANSIYAGVYLVSRIDRTRFSVRLHGPTGPRHTITVTTGLIK